MIGLVTDAVALTLQMEGALCNYYISSSSETIFVLDTTNVSLLFSILKMKQGASLIMS